MMTKEYILSMGELSKQPVRKEVIPIDPNKGITFNKSIQKWEVYVYKNGKNNYIGSFWDKKSAYEAREKAKIKLGVVDKEKIIIIKDTPWKGAQGCNDTNSKCGAGNDWMCESRYNLEV